jgi:hypothetical protein
MLRKIQSNVNYSGSGFQIISEHLESCLQKEGQHFKIFPIQNSGTISQILLPDSSAGLILGYFILFLFIKANWDKIHEFKQK